MNQPRRVAVTAPRVVDVPTAAAMLGVSRSWLYEMAHRGEIAVIRLSPRKVVVAVSEVDRFVAEKQAAANAEANAKKQAAREAAARRWANVTPDERKKQDRLAYLD